MDRIGTYLCAPPITGVGKRTSAHTTIGTPIVRRRRAVHAAPPAGEAVLSRRSQTKAGSSIPRLRARTEAYVDASWKLPDIGRAK
jgi:hypothetical protein